MLHDVLEFYFGYGPKGFVFAVMVTGAGLMVGAYLIVGAIGGVVMMIEMVVAPFRWVITKIIERRRKAVAR